MPSTWPVVWHIVGILCPSCMAIICADTYCQLGTHMLRVRLTWIQFTGFRAFTVTSPLSPASLVGSASATRIYSDVVVAWPVRSLPSWLCFSTRLYSRIQHGWTNIIYFIMYTLFVAQWHSRLILGEIERVPRVDMLLSAMYRL